MSGANEMSDEAQKPHDKYHTVGRVAAGVLTISIVVAAFWHTHLPGSGPGPEPDGEHGRDFGGRQGMTGIEDDGGTFRRAFAGPVFLEAYGRPATSFDFRMRPFGLMDDDSRMLLRSLRVVLNDPNTDRLINLTQDQWKNLQAIEMPRMVISDDDRAQIERLWQDMDAASDAQKPAAQQKLLDGLRDVGDRSTEPTKKAWADAANQVKQILTTQQLAKLSVYEGSGGVYAPIFPPTTMHADRGHRD